MSTCTILFGTETGNAEMAADDIAAVLGDIDGGMEVTIVGMEDYDVTGLAGAGVIILVTSTYGEGELPVTAQPFHDALTVVAPELSGLRFGAFGLGDSTYDTYNNAIDIMASALTDAGATQVGETGRHDAASGLLVDQVVTDWAQQFTASLSASSIRS